MAIRPWRLKNFIRLMDGESAGLPLVGNFPYGRESASKPNWRLQSKALQNRRGNGAKSSELHDGLSKGRRNFRQWERFSVSQNYQPLSATTACGLCGGNIRLARLQAVKAPQESAKKRKSLRIFIVPDGVHVGGGAVFASRNPISQSKSRFHAVSAPGNPQNFRGNWRGWPEAQDSAVSPKAKPSRLKLKSDPPYPAREILPPSARLSTILF